MRIYKTLLALGLTGAILAVSVTGAEARWFRHGGGGYYHGGYYHGGPGLVGGLVLGAAAVATLPFAVLGAAVNPAPAYGYGPPPPPPPPPGYYGRGYYGPPPGYYGGY